MGRMTTARPLRRAAIATAVAAAPLALAYRFALVYRARAGFPERHPPTWTPDAVGLGYEEVEVATADGLRLPAWFIPAGDNPAPGVLLIHGWESARDRTLPNARILHAIGFHVLTLDVRGHGANGPELLPMSVGEYAADARAGAAWLRDRQGVTKLAILGHSMGGAGSLVATATDPGIDAVVAVATPADPARLTRLTFQLAHLPIPAPVAWPLAWLTTRVYLRPRGHSVASVSATKAVQSAAAPVMLIHGTDDAIVPLDHLERLARARRAVRPASVTETLVIPGGQHSWLYELPAYRSAVARFLAEHLGGPLDPDVAARTAAAVPAVRLPDAERLTSLDIEPGGLRSFASLVRRTG
jgi:dipeptidyl aminopeptidase/acylaminoacyl peptidase